jgi:hypothetical protein
VHPRVDVVVPNPEGVVRHPRADLMSRKVRVAADKQLVYSRGITSPATPSPRPMTLQKWIDTSSPPPRVDETRRRPIEENAPRAIYVAQQRGLPQGIEGRGAAPPETQEQLARASEEFSSGLLDVRF